MDDELEPGTVDLDPDEPPFLMRVDAILSRLVAEGLLKEEETDDVARLQDLIKACIRKD